MPEDKYRDFLSTQERRAKAAVSEVERVEALRRLFCGVLALCAERVIDAELAPIDGTPAEPKLEVRPESAYYPYHLARQSGFADFTDQQRQVLKGLVMHTAFDVLDAIFHRLDSFVGFQVGISLYSYAENLSKEHQLRSLETDDLASARIDIPKALTKHEY